MPPCRYIFASSPMKSKRGLGLCVASPSVHSLYFATTNQTPITQRLIYIAWCAFQHSTHGFHRRKQLNVSMLVRNLDLSACHVRSWVGNNHSGQKFNISLFHNYTISLVSQRLEVTSRAWSKDLISDPKNEGGYFSFNHRLSSCQIHLLMNQGNIVQCIASALGYTTYSPSLDSALGHLQAFQAIVRVGD